ncbi:hypothetical protein [Streptomyces sp. NPDC046988]|uniref:hypothetical protein n=1 Tax=Streptomyces sp. NPDC046988 TaxID=3154922 RepID=UPI0033C42BF0
MADDASAPEPKKGPVREVADFLADLDDVLATSTAPTIPPPAAQPDPAPDAASTMPDVDLNLDVDGKTEPAPAPDAAPPSPPRAPSQPPRAEDWWSDVYQHDTADQDTFTGNKPVRVPVAAATPAASKDAAAAPAQPVAAEDDPDEEDDDDDNQDETPEPKKAWAWWKKDETSQDDGEGDEASDEEASAPAATGGRFTGAVKSAGPVIAGTTHGGGLFNNPRGRQVVFAATAYAAGWGLRLDDWVTGLMAHADQYATPVAGCSLGLGIVALAMRSKLGGVVFVSSLALITALQMARPAWVVGGGVALGFQVAYRVVRGWVGRHGEKWPWKGVVWAAHIPAATATVACLLFGTN